MTTRHLFSIFAVWLPSAAAWLPPHQVLRAALPSPPAFLAAASKSRSDLRSRINLVQRSLRFRCSCACLLCCLFCRHRCCARHLCSYLPRNNFDVFQKGDQMWWQLAFGDRVQEVVFDQRKIWIVLRSGLGHLEEQKKEKQKIKIMNRTTKNKNKKKMWALPGGKNTKKFAHKRPEI